MADFDGFAPIEAIFYSVFHPTEGTKVSQQVPLGSIVTPSKTTSDVLSEPIIDFDVIKNYVIPKPPLCNRLLTLKVGQYRVIGYPVNIIASHYARNSFTFNFCFVFKYESDTTPYEPSIQRLGKMFKNLEEQYQLFSRKERDILYFRDENRHSSTNVSQGGAAGGHPSSANDNFKDQEDPRPGSIDMNESAVDTSSSTYKQIVNDLNNDIDSSTPLGIVRREGYTIKLESIESLIQQIYQDLNNYSECLIPIDSGNSVDIKLFPLLSPPPSLNQEDVPISTVRLESMVDVNWDPTMLKIMPFINGINSIKRISSLANADYWIVKQCIQHLTYYKCIIIIDIFQFSNIYAPTSDIDMFLKDAHMATECQAYVVSPSIFKDRPFQSEPTNSNGNGNSNGDKTGIGGHGINSKTTTARSNGNRKDDSSLSLNRELRRDQREVILLPSKAKLFYLYRSLHQGQSVKNWYKEHMSELEHIDIRRFLSFGVLRGLIYRVHSYPVVDSILLNEDQSQFKKPFGSISGSSAFVASEDEGDYDFEGEDDDIEEENAGEEDENDDDDDDDDEDDAAIDPRSPLSNNHGKKSSPKSPRNPFNKRGSNQFSTSDLTDEQREKVGIILKNLKNFKNLDAICTEIQTDRKTAESLLRKIDHYNIVNS